jgi:hypothetical protein
LVATWRDSGGRASNLALLRLMVVPLSAYLLLTTTVHPWYVTLLLPLLPFLASGSRHPSSGARLLWAWLYFAWAVSLSYLSYLEAANVREYPLVRPLEYLPLYLGLLWAAWPASASAGSSAAGPDPLRSQSSPSKEATTGLPRH